MSTLAQRLETELQDLASEYQTHFAGQNRLDRDVSKMDDMLKRAQEVVRSIESLPAAVRPAELAQLLDLAKNTVTLYQTEKRAIAQAQEAGPAFQEFGELASRANFVFARYVRHFAGQSRGTRDIGLLSEMISDLDRIHGEMKEVARGAKNGSFDGDIKLVSDNKKMYEQEKSAIEKTWTEGTQEDQANRLAALANTYFAVYRVHFAGASRVTRRPALLMRAIDGLKKVHAGMKALSDKGFSSEHHPKNMEIVKQQLEMYEKELEEIRKAKKGTSMVDLMGALGEGANQIFQEYRDSFAGKARSQVDREKLGNICDKLGEILRQMDDFARAEQNDMNEGNRTIVLDQLATFEGEYDAVVKTQKTA